MPHPVGHVVSDADKSTSGHAGSSTGNASGLVGRLRKRVEQSDKDRVIVVWGSYNREHEEPEPEVHQETDHVTQSASLMLRCCEEVTSTVSVFACLSKAVVGTCWLLSKADL